MAFMKALVPAVDPGHARPVYVVGYSNGARLAYRVACTDPGLFDAYAAVKGGPNPSCMPGKPVTIAQLASLDDPEAPYKPGGKTSSTEPIPVTTLVARLRETDKVHGSARRDAVGEHDPGHVVRVRSRHPARVRDLDGRQALLPAAPGQRPGGRAGHLVLLHEHPAGAASVAAREVAAAPSGRGGDQREGQPHRRAATAGRLGGYRAAVAE